MWFLSTSLSAHLIFIITCDIDSAIVFQVVKWIPNSETAES